MYYAVTAKLKFALM